jgi:hypothetical protein
VAHFKTQHVAYRKTGLEWEILGDLGLRLHHKEEAKEAYQRCLDAPRYSVKPWLKLMEMYAEEGDIQRSIQAAIRVAAYQWADYTEMTVSLLCHPCLKPRLMALAVSNPDCPSVLQAGPDPRTRQDLVHVAKHGSAGTDSEDHGQLSSVREGVQGGRVGFLIH